MSAEDRDVIVLDDAVKHFPLPRRGFRPRERVHSIDGVTLRVRHGEVLGLVGESGSGKSTLARVVLGLTPTTSGRVAVDGVDVGHLSGAERKRLTRTAQLVFQDPHAAMDPRMTIGESLCSVFAQHGIGRKHQRVQAASEALAEVGLDQGYLDRYPAECSGGQLQRVVIARALLLRPKLLICDEPTSALDASVQARILNLLHRLRRDHQLTMVMISHDLRVVRFIGDRIAVMYLGQIVEIADRDVLFERSCHPYTLTLLASAGACAQAPPEVTATGEPPSPIHPPSGCRFHPRCPLATERCRSEVPQPQEIAPGHQVRCHHWNEARITLATEESR
ncbi:ABC transporter ATP-binding protein [Saccharopolyspora sp. WRP15-2]|uniref:ABC transporter ATP-binding protein n=1 Tax=Saccharopolyspora oryzae TaxID=2997343 RepID=A0ABT4UWQ8_9PSEU|nr:ABC transporter ATP-binding protein [Saccharopolyspora oryzae]MDA3625517.1 ABC transporter ATP-binding protein [Saccharopolyspora oryzae]